jgi:uncharacterized membrane protein YvlD (DUF360 family)
VNYLRSLFLNFLIVFFVDRVVPGIEISNYEQVPNVGADILFSLVIGFLNASIFFFLVILELNISIARLVFGAVLVSFTGFAAIAMFPFGVSVVSPIGFILGGSIVACVSFFTNFLEWRHYDKVQ